MKILITGGAGYIGSHTLVEVIRSGHQVVVVDSLVNGHAEAIGRVGRLTNTDVQLAVGDIRDKPFLESVFTEFVPDAVIHFAGLKAVGESVENPLAYYDVNVSGSRVLLEVMQSHCCTKIVFSSSATVYGEPQYLPYDENHPVAPINPYGRTKLMVEQMLEDWSAAQPERSAISLRYFNPVGAHPSGFIGEDPLGQPNNLMPFIAQVAVGIRAELQTFGDDVGTRDRTGERGYLHIVDLTKAYVLSLTALAKQAGHDVINLNTGHGVTVKEMVKAFKIACGHFIDTRTVARRAGNLPSFYSNSERAQARLGWVATLRLADMCRDTWIWQRQNPGGYKASECQPNLTGRCANLWMLGA
jgi:UDP-glucose 4-epimerase